MNFVYLVFIMRSNIVFMVFLALFVMVFISSNNARQIQVDDSDDSDFQISDARARAFLDTADGEYAKRATGKCITCSKLTHSQCCEPDLCVKKTFHNECIKIKPGK
jgi:hypothetical protein